jgi:TRAP transporter TAXI family solute receptor
VARRDSQIHSIRDLVGKRISVGAARSGNELNARALLGAVGLSYADLLRVEYLHYGETMELLAKNELDAAIVSAGLGVSAVVDAMQRSEAMLVPIEPQVVLANPRMFFATSIPAQTYPGQRDAVATAALNNYFVTSSEVPEPLVYDITKAIFDHLDELRAARSAMKTISVEGALRVRPIEAHPGALRYFKTVGALK